MKTFFKKIVFFFLLLFLHGGLFAQSNDNVDFEIDSIAPNEKDITIFFRALNTENSKPIKVTHTNLKITETIGSLQRELIVYPGNIKDTLIIRKNVAKVEKFNAVFLLDVSKKMTNEDLKKAKNLIREIHGKVANAGNSNFQLITFDDEIGVQKTLTVTNIESTLNQIKRSNKNPDFYNATIQTIRNLKRATKDKKILFILSNGVNEVNGNPTYNTQIPYKADDVHRQVEDLGIDFYIFPIPFSNNTTTDFLKKIIEDSKADDSFQRGTLPKNWQDILKNNETVAATRYVKVYNESILRGERRDYKLEWKGKTADGTFCCAGSQGNPIQHIGMAQFGVYSLIGILIILGILGICVLIVPFIRNLNFKKNFVKPYVAEANRRKIDPITSEAIQAGELVVHKCRQLTPLTTWEGLGGQCPNYPDCMDFNNPCKGEGAPLGSDNFFSMNGAYRRLNWMWFGATGGLIAWVIFYLFKLLSFDWYRNLISGFLEASIFRNDASINNDTLKYQLENLSNDTLAGAMFGLGLIFMLSWVEEKSQPRQISWGRIILRTFLGMLISLFVFLVGFLLQFYDIIPKGYFGGLITWLLLGVALGTVLSIKSSISLTRGVIGGLISIAIAYHVYLLLGAITSDYIFGKLLSLILLGGVLGWILETVVTRLEDFELEYISPETFRSVVPISKWLKAGIDIFIGTDSGSYIYVKWDDGAVQPQHAKLLYQNGVVYIEPMAETLVKGRILPYNRKTVLKNGDVIQLGRESITRMRYREKGRATLNGTSSNGAPPPPPPRPDDGKPKIRIKR